LRIRFTQVSIIPFVSVGDKERISEIVSNPTEIIVVLLKPKVGEGGGFTSGKGLGSEVLY
jgi:hypothetical protein